MSYRGYGETPGSPSQAALFSDALAVYDHVVNELKIPPSQIFLMGRSIGSSVAAYLASKRSVQGLILITPFDRIGSIVKQFFLFRPFVWILRGNFNTIDYLQKADINTLILAAGRDEIVPKSSTDHLVSACRSKITLAEIPAADHQNISDFPAYYEAIYRSMLTQNL
jgi:alpha-beta hydrolase superfamily lysophospholipase